MTGSLVRGRLFALGCFRTSPAGSLRPVWPIVCAGRNGRRGAILGSSTSITGAIWPYASQSATTGSERVISAFIDAHPEDTARKLRELQAHVDATRAVAGAPLQAARQLLGLIDERLEAMRDRMLELQAENDRIAAALRRLS